MLVKQCSTSSLEPSIKGGMLSHPDALVMTSAGDMSTWRICWEGVGRSSVEGKM